MKTESATGNRPWIVLAITSLAVFAASLDTSIMYMAFPDIGRTFPNVSQAQLSWVINAYTIIFAALLVPAGRLADRIGRRGVFIVGTVIFTSASALAGAAPSPELLIAARSLQAVGGALVFPSSLALILHEFPLSKRATAVGIWGAVGALAAALGPSVGGVVIDSLSWRWAFYINVPVGIAAFTLGLRVLRESKAQEVGPRPDLLGIPLLIAAIGALAFGIVQSDEWGWGDTRVLGGFGLAAVAGPLFILRSARHASPALDLSLFRDHNYRVANVATFVFGTAFASMFLTLVLFLTYVWGYSPLEAGLLIWPGPLTAALVAGPAGRLVDRIGHRRIMIPGGLLFAAGNAWLFLNAGTEPNILGVWIPSAIITGVGVGLTLPSLSSAAVRSLPSNRFAVGSAVNQTVRQIGAVLGVALTIAIVGTHRPGEMLDVFDRVYLLLVAGGLVTAALSAALDTRPKPVTEASAIARPKEGIA